MYYVIKIYEYVASEKRKVLRSNGTYPDLCIG